MSTLAKVGPGALGISCTPYLPETRKIPSEEYINSSRIKPEKENVSMTPMQQPLKGDREDENFLEAAISTASDHFWWKNEVIRVGGGLSNSPYTIDRKIPILIPRKSPITEFLIRDAHKKNLHGGPQLTFYKLRRTIWITGGLPVVKSVLYRCKPSIRFDAKLLQPQMGDLPRKIVVPSFAFNHCGLD